MVWWLSSLEKVTANRVQIPDAAVCISQSPNAIWKGKFYTTITTTLNAALFIACIILNNGNYLSTFSFFFFFFFLLTVIVIYYLTKYLFSFVFSSWVNVTSQGEGQVEFTPYKHVVLFKW